jgi:predicted Zn-ribbon and HTH transcriptional regulator
MEGLSSSMAEKPSPAPSERSETVREAIAAELRQQRLTARELSERVHLSEREVIGHLEHLARSARSRGERLTTEPARCLACGFAFATRDRLTKPGKCPSCRATHLSPPRFSLG